MAGVRTCMVMGCRNAVHHYREGLCQAHSRQRQRELHAQRVRRGIRETGQARVQALAGVPELELTDGQMTWWVTTAAWERRGWNASRRGAD